ncbi:MAG: serine hydroxymethyltransferase [Candidatus Pacebacteria bacterium]|jgi:glycine hydroxymethyltransferase|nr:serine hydroxymethyltransferase [Candidatus Paceibacterota bacterium]MBT4652698.1 serine hydroxymethyltransferase [Candidatus Paceibacterota bacterium]MBT6755855.1 serine hydroxymethyltransferase [Candidatus Paceibacterota bacterium]MBT6921068.1 serine hydroxymethyltransferase [Candidatus Paceibacterota bacterium]
MKKDKVNCKTREDDLGHIVFSLINKECDRQTKMIGLIPSENHISPEVSEVLSSCLSSKYAEGYPHRRYYEGNQFVDEIEVLAQERIKKLFGVPHVNVQPYSGSPANGAIEFALLEPGDTMMGLALSGGGHLTHGHPKVTFSGKYFNSVQYGLDENARIDFEQVRELALKHKPKLIIAGNTAYPFELDFAKFREIADEVGAWLLADISHVTGLVVAEEHLSPVPFADVIMSTTHKTFRGPRGAMILVTQKGLDRDPDLGKKIDKAVFPALQGGPHNATTAGIAIAAEEAARPEFKKYGQQVRKNADVLAASLQEKGLKLVGGGTETHLMLLDLTPYGEGMGLQVAFAMDVAGLYANRNTIPHEPCSPFYPSGIRLGTPLVTSRGMKEKEMEQIADWIVAVVDEVKGEQLPSDKKERRQFIKDFRVKALKNEKLLAIRHEVETLAEKYPLFTWE